MPRFGWVGIPFIGGIIQLFYFSSKFSQEELLITLPTNCSTRQYKDDATQSNRL